ncbi:MAG: DUF448 domain-containing protein [Novosphingobium sp.]|nr:DUF448 domain-containing protein [Novosphingobium sp.]
MRTPRNERLKAGNFANGPERKCILSGAHGARDKLIRLAISPEGEVLPDIHARAPGRGAWIGVDQGALERALANGRLKAALSRAFRGASLSIPSDLPERIAQALLRVLTDRLGLELRAGHMLLGFDRIAEQARAGRVCWLGHAADASEDGRRKLDQALRVGLGMEGSGRGGYVLPLDRVALSVALGRDNVVHLALSDPAAADRVELARRRLLHFQGQAEATGITAKGQAANAARSVETLN